MLAVFAVALMILTGVIYWAAEHLNRGEYWADRICSAAQGLCGAPHWLLIATGVAIVLALIRQMLKT
jgi:hypothetical protein